MSDQERWLHVLGPFQGDALEQAHDAGGIDSVIDPEVAQIGGVYLWTRKISPPSDAMANAGSFSEWLKEMLLRRQGVVSGPLSHVGQMELQLGGAGLTTEKWNAIEEISETYEQRKAVRSLLSEFDHKVVLYVGEAQCFETRLSSHLSGITGFSERRKLLGHQWSDLGLLLVPMPGSDKPQREALERTLAILTLAPLTSRAG
jgi:hypothetical protein